MKRIAWALPLVVLVACAPPRDGVCEEDTISLAGSCVSSAGFTLITLFASIAIGVWWWWHVVSFMDAVEARLRSIDASLEKLSRD